jgi:hypothetical protein
MIPVTPVAYANWRGDPPHVLSLEVVELAYLTVGLLDNGLSDG